MSTTSRTTSRLVTAALSITLAGAALGSVAGTVVADPIPTPKTTPSSSTAKHVPATQLSKSALAAESCSIPGVADDGVLMRLDSVADKYKVNSTVRLAMFETAWVESHASNLPCGERDSVGVFQQRPSSGWGTAAQAQDPVQAATKFLYGIAGDAGAIRYNASHPTYSAGRIAQLVQRSARPDAYDQAASKAKVLLARADGIRHGNPAAGHYNWPDVQQGEKNDRVRVIQLLLKAHKSNITADGSFGPTTVSTVKAFQTKAGLSHDGIVGPNTWGKLIVGSHKGSAGYAVLAAQWQLRASGYQVNVDGHYTQATANAVAAFRKNYKLPAGTSVDSSVWNTLITMHI